MNNLSLVIQREYLVRVRKKSFILTTLLTPIGIALFYGIVILMVMYQGDDYTKVAVIDEGNILTTTRDSSSNILFQKESASLEVLKNNLEEKGYNGVLRLAAIDDLYGSSLVFDYYAAKTPSLETKSKIENWLDKQVVAYKMNALDLDTNKLAALKTTIALESKPLQEDSNDKPSSSISSEVAAIIATVMGSLMFFVITLYGGMVLRGVMEEKMNRIVEVMISSVKPFHLMLGKIIAIGLVGLTQIVIWTIFIPLVLLVLTFAFGLGGELPTNVNLPGSAGAMAEFNNPETLVAAQKVMMEIQAQNWGFILPSIVLFFLGGYFMYAALFAAVGSAIGDDLGESQTLTLPIMLPVILAFYITILLSCVPLIAVYRFGVPCFPCFRPS
ncbi:MAG: ABC transporter permease [Saprospiraceae bacterium]|nr:ABC transporter permease [Saprospiraceae bacterium]